MGLVILDSLEAKGAAGLFVDDDFHLREIKIERAVGKAAPAQHGSELPGGMQTAREFIVRSGLEDGEGFLVGEPPRTLDHRSRETRAPHRAVFGKADENGMG